MKRNTKFRAPVVLLTVGTMAAALTVSASPASASTFSITPWGQLGGTGNSGPTNDIWNFASGPYVNAAGDAAGTGQVGGGPAIHATLYKNGVLTDLGGGDGNHPYTYGEAINSSDVEVGFELGNSGESINQMEPVEWTNGHLQQLAVDHFGNAVAINDAGTVVGTEAFGPGLVGLQAVEYHGNYPTTVLGDIPNHASPEDVEAGGISQNGQVIGTAINNSGGSEAVTFSGGNAQPLPMLSGYAQTQTTSISPDGSFIAGNAFTGQQYQVQAVEWIPGSVTGPLRLDNLSTDSGSFVYSVNSMGLAVGLALNGQVDPSAPGAIRSVLFEYGNVIDLKSYLPANSGWSSIEALGINDNNVIVGTGIYNGHTQGFTMTLPPINPPGPRPGFPLLAAILRGLLKLLGL